MSDDAVWKRGRCTCVLRVEVRLEACRAVAVPMDLAEQAKIESNTTATARVGTAVAQIATLFRVQVSNCVPELTLFAQASIAEGARAKDSIASYWAIDIRNPGIARRADA